MAYTGGQAGSVATAGQGLFSFAVPGSGFFMDSGGLGFTQGLTDALGLTTNPYIASDMAAYNPYNVNTGYGVAGFDQGTNTFRSGLSPQFQQMQQGLFGQIGQFSPDNYLSLLRQRADPQNRANYNALENRLFSQGRLDASQEYDPGGAMRGLFDAQAMQDMGFQLTADQMAQNLQMSTLDQILGISGLEQSLFNPLYQQGSLQVQGSGNAANAFSQQAGANQNVIGGIFSDVLGGIF